MFSPLAFVADVFLCIFLVALSTSTCESVLRWRAEKRRFVELLVMVNPIVWMVLIVALFLGAYRALIAIADN